MPPPRLVLLDVNETLVRLDPLEDVLAAAGAPPGLVAPWFAGVLRDGFALAVLGELAEFRPLATEGLARLLARHVDRPVQVAEDVLDGFADLPLHDDVVPGLEVLAEAGCRLATFTNGSAAVTDRLLAGTGADALVTDRLDVTGAGAWKPAGSAYRWACDRLGVAPPDATLVAVHPWDVAGARRAGLEGAWLDRDGLGWPAAFGPAPEVVATDLPALARALVDGR